MMTHGDFRKIVTDKLAEFDGICTRRHDGHPTGHGCSDCGHAWALHPGVANPALDSCLVCRLVEVVQTPEQVDPPGPRSWLGWST